MATAESARSYVRSNGVKAVGVGPGRIRVEKARSDDKKEEEGKEKVSDVGDAPTSPEIVSQTPKVKAIMSGDREQEEEGEEGGEEVAETKAVKSARKRKERLAELNEEKRYFAEQWLDRFRKEEKRAKKAIAMPKTHYRIHYLHELKKQVEKREGKKVAVLYTTILPLFDFCQTSELVLDSIKVFPGGKVVASCKQAVEKRIEELIAMKGDDGEPLLSESEIARLKIRYGKASWKLPLPHPSSFGSREMKFSGASVWSSYGSGYGSNPRVFEGQDRVHCFLMDVVEDGKVPVGQTTSAGEFNGSFSDGITHVVFLKPCCLFGKEIE